MQRSRSRVQTSTAFSGDRLMFEENPGRYTLYAAGQRMTIQTLTETMVDEVSPGRMSKYCKHVRGYQSGKVQLVWTKVGGSYPNRVYIQYPVFANASAPGTSPTFNTTMTQAAAVRDMLLGNLNDSVLAPVFIKELPEMRTIHKTLLEKGFGAKKFANKFLAFKFGILPFIGDLKKLVDGHKKINQHIKFINDSYGKIVRVGTNSGSCSGRIAYYFPTSATSSRSEYTDWIGSCRTMAKLKIVRQYTAQDKINAYLDYYGASVAKCLWEATRYSFVVDWFIDVGGVIDYLSPKFQVPCARVIDVCTVSKASASFPCYTWDELSDSRTSYGSINYKFMERVPSGVTPTSILGSGLDFSKALVGGALVIQRV